MSLPGMSDDGTAPVKRSSEYDYMARDIVGRKRIRKGGADRWHAVLLQAVFGYIGAGYVYLGQTRKALASAAVFIVCAAVILGIEMLIFPNEAVVNYSMMPLQYAAYAVFFAAVIAYFLSIYDCYRTALRLAKTGGGGSVFTREPTKAERMEGIFSEHDTRRSEPGDM